ncbi:hypothetical protein NPIL_86031 [Nephila pilipes]|uniref:Uncharacterized protein n=1 Tax=Nephila pilipes TaxID=299642 RepID=A0A8X6NVE2_NEPPI|nr:hypothetical protein NPIL_86031 [Nephila pilipes]
MKIVHMITGHGRLPAYLKRFRIADKGTSVCSDFGDVVHYIKNFSHKVKIRNQSGIEGPAKKRWYPSEYHGEYCCNDTHHLKKRC